MTDPGVARPDAASASEVEQLRRMIGGGRDIADGAIPSIIFVAANAVWSLRVAVLAAATYGVGVTLYRLARKQGARHPLMGLLGLGLSGGIALWTGSASAYFVPGVIIGALVGSFTLLTVVIKRPSSAMFAMALERKPPEHYQRPDVLRAHMIITTLWALVFLGRAGLRAYLIAKDQTALLGASALVLGYPLTLGLAALTVVYLKRFPATPTADPVASA